MVKRNKKKSSKEDARKNALSKIRSENNNLDLSGDDVDEQSIEPSQNNKVGLELYAASVFENASLAAQFFQHIYSMLLNIFRLIDFNVSGELNAPEEYDSIYFKLVVAVCFLVATYLFTKRESINNEKTRSIILGSDSEYEAFSKVLLNSRRGDDDRDESQVPVAISESRASLANKIIQNNVGDVFAKSGTAVALSVAGIFMTSSRSFYLASLFMSMLVSAYRMKTLYSFYSNIHDNCDALAKVLPVVNGQNPHSLPSFKKWMYTVVSEMFENLEASQDSQIKASVWLNLNSDLSFLTSKDISISKEQGNNIYADMLRGELSRYFPNTYIKVTANIKNPGNDHDYLNRLELYFDLNCIDQFANNAGLFKREFSGKLKTFSSRLEKVAKFQKQLKRFLSASKISFDQIDLSLQPSDAEQPSLLKLQLTSDGQNTEEVKALLLEKVQGLGDEYIFVSGDNQLAFLFPLPSGLKFTFPMGRRDNMDAVQGDFVVEANYPRVSEYVPIRRKKKIKTRKKPGEFFQHIKDKSELEKPDHRVFFPGFGVYNPKCVEVTYQPMTIYCSERDGVEKFYLFDENFDKNYAGNSVLIDNINTALRNRLEFRGHSNQVVSTRSLHGKARLVDEEARLVSFSSYDFQQRDGTYKTLIIFSEYRKKTHIRSESTAETPKPEKIVWDEKWYEDNILRLEPAALAASPRNM